MAAETAQRRVAGRPREFDANVALDKAVRLFWRHGYEATSMADLVASLGIGAPSLYAAFGNKAQLFAKALERYAATFSVTLYDVIGDPSLTTLAAVEKLFDQAARQFSEPDTPGGCFMYSAAAAVSPTSGAIEALLRGKRAEFEARLAERLMQGISRGDMRSSINPVATAKYLNCILQGMSLQARDGARYADLKSIVQRALASWT
jgi:AcrR family transcriptional regulator